MKKGLLLMKCCLLFIVTSWANTIIVKNIEELRTANKQAKPGDIIILQNGEWNNVIISLNCKGTKELPIIFKAQTAGKVLVTGESKLRLGGNFIVVEGLYFTKGYAGDDPVISYRVNKEQLANNCRVTDCVINDFNNPERMEENNWVLFYGKNNKLDHCSFIDKKNMGVLLAVILDDERSRENFHSIDHNYFGRRIPLASNGGEIIRVGVSQHCEFNSNTRITSNFFEHCDGETEIISIKSGSNLVNLNIFKECQGSVVLRHGDNNRVAVNIFLGNDKPGTGGVRVINKGQQVIENMFYKCRGVDFRSPLAIMNGIPNSPANRYVQVTDAVISNNTFYECSPMSFGEGSDAERTLAPERVKFSRNIYYNKRDSIIYRVYDKISGFEFIGNMVNPELPQLLIPGFERSKNVVYATGVNSKGSMPPDMEKEAYKTRGATWFAKKKESSSAKPITVQCETAMEVYTQLVRNVPINIRLTGSSYTLDRPFNIGSEVQFTGNKEKLISFNTSKIESVFKLAGKGKLLLQELNINGSNVKATHFISNDSSGSSEHHNLKINDCRIEGFDREKGCEDLVFAYKSSVADSIIIRNSNFLNNKTNGFVLNQEKDNKGYYPVEKITITKNKFSGQKGFLLDLYRGGNDESTLGPQLVFSNNQVSGCQTANEIPLIRLTGVQVTSLISNSFSDCNETGILILYKDIVRARHFFEKNTFIRSGRIEKNTLIEKGDKTY